MADRNLPPPLFAPASRGHVRFVGDTVPPPPPLPPSPEAARVAGRLWAEGTANTSGGACGAWPGTLDDVRLMRPDMTQEAATACQEAAAERWREMAQEKALRDITRANERAADLLSRLASAADRATAVHLVGVSTVQMPVVATGLETPHGPLLVTLEAYSDGTWVARLPNCGGLDTRANSADLAVSRLRDAVVTRALRDSNDAAGRALVSRVETSS